MGHPADQITGPFDVPSPFSMMFVFTPTSPYTPAEAEATLGWVRRGGVLVYASEQGDAELDKSLGVSRLRGTVSGGQYTPTPLPAAANPVGAPGHPSPPHPPPPPPPPLHT